MPTSDSSPTDRNEKAPTLDLSQVWAWRGLGVVGFAMLTAIFAQFEFIVPLPPDGIPMSLQSLFVVLSALMLGPKYGLAAMGLYLLVGAIGAPVFSDGNAGPLHLAGQTGGYLIGFLLCQPVVGWIIRGPDGVRGWGALLLGITAAHVIIFGVGVPWLAIARDFTLGRAIEGGFVPFIPGMLIKTALAFVIGLKVAPFAMRKIW